MIGADMVATVDDLDSFGVFFSLLHQGIASVLVLTLLVAGVTFVCVCVGVGCVHPSYAEAGCVLIVFVSP
jgi:hypothetical protein